MGRAKETFLGGLPVASCGELRKRDVELSPLVPLARVWIGWTFGRSGIACGGVSRGLTSATCRPPLIVKILTSICSTDLVIYSDKLDTVTLWTVPKLRIFSK